RMKNGIAVATTKHPAATIPRPTLAVFRTFSPVPSEYAPTAAPAPAKNSPTATSGAGPGTLTWAIGPATDRQPRPSGGCMVRSPGGPRSGPPPRAGSAGTGPRGGRPVFG